MQGELNDEEVLVNQRLEVSSFISWLEIKIKWFEDDVSSHRKYCLFCLFEFYVNCFI